jgi:hypothetical protein
MRDLGSTPPGAIVVEYGDVFFHVTGDTFDSAESLPGFPELFAFVERNYRYEVSVGKFDVYLRRSN